MRPIFGSTLLLAALFALAASTAHVSPLDPPLDEHAVAAVDDHGMTAMEVATFPALESSAIAVPSKAGPFDLMEPRDATRIAARSARPSVLLGHQRHADLMRPDRTVTARDHDYALRAHSGSAPTPPLRC